MAKRYPSLQERPEPDRVPAVPPRPAVALTDDGVPYDWLSGDHRTLVNLSNPASPLDARRRELHVAGRCFAHVAETTAGAWIYRCDD